MNDLFDTEVRGHHSMRDLVLTAVPEDDLAYQLPGSDPTLGGLLIEMGHRQWIYAHSFETSDLDWEHRRLPAPGPGGDGHL